MTKITFNHERALEVAQKIIAKKSSGEHPFNHPDLFPDAIIPQRVEPGSLDHALYLFHAVSLDQARDSRKVYASMRAIHEALGNFRELHEISGKKLKELLSKHLEKNPHITPGKPLERLKENSWTLSQSYGSDSRNLKRETLEATSREIRKFGGYGKRNDALLTKNYVKFGIWDFSPYEICIKPDRHMVRIAIGCGILQLPPGKVRADEAARVIREGYLELCIKERISAIDFNDGLWAIGSYLCTQNSIATCQRKCPVECSSRPRAGRTATEYFPGSESREMTPPLFDF